jgi:hypothetical protein
MRLGEVSLPSRIEEILDSIEIEKESVAPAAGEKLDAARGHDVGLGSERDFPVRDDFLPDA